MKRNSTYGKQGRYYTQGWISLLLFFMVLLSAKGQQRSTVGEYEVSGPYHHGGLTVFLVHGESTPHTIPFFTLEEAMKEGVVKVYETGTVNQLAIENLSSDHEIFIQAGEIVKGGRQDRTLGVDLTLAPNSGRVPIASFCVEKGRWSKRGDESAGEFNGTYNMVASNGLRVAIRKARNQSQVWSQVSVMQEKLSDNLGVQVHALGEATSSARAEPLSIEPAVINVAANAETFEENVPDQRIINNEISQSATRNVFNPGQIDPLLRNSRIVQGRVDNGMNRGDGYTTSLQLSLENETLTNQIEEYVAALQDIIREHDDVIGFAFTVNGEMKSADVYASNELFSRLWPRLLRAAAAEAIAEKRDEEVIGTVDAVAQCIQSVEGSSAEEEKVSDRIQTVTRENEEHILFETRDSDNRNGWIHRNYMKLE